MKEFLIYLYFASVLCGCSLYVSIEGKKKECVQPVEVKAVEPVSAKPKPKTRYQQLKDEHNQEWLNLPHRESENELFQPK